MGPVWGWWIVSFDPVSYAMGAQAAGGGGGGGGGDENRYEKLTIISLTSAANTWSDDSTITVDCTYMARLSSAFTGGSGNPGYRKIKLLHLPTSGIDCTGIFSNHGANSALEEIELDGDLHTNANAGTFFYNCKSLKNVVGGRIDLTNATSVSNFASNAEKIETIRFVPSCIKKTITFAGAAQLSKESVVSIANGLDEEATGQTLTLDGAVKTAYGSVTGTVTDGVFAADPAGPVTLMDFITQTKGWTLA